MHAGFAPVDRDSGTIGGNLRRPHRFHRTLRPVSSCPHCPRSDRIGESAANYQRKRAEGQTHRQAIGALGRRRINVLWTMIQTRQPYRTRPALA